MKANTGNTRHNHTEIIRTLRLLEQNDFNYLQTSKQSKIARQTIKLWEKKYGHEVFNNLSPMEKALKEIDVEMKNNDINVIRNLYILRKRALYKVMSIIENESKLDALINVLKYVSSEIQKFTDQEKPEYNPIQDTMSFIKVINDHLKAREGESGYDKLTTNT